MSLIQTRSFYGDLIKGLEAKFAQVFDENINTYQSGLKGKLFQVMNTDKAREHVKLVAGTGYLRQKEEGAPIVRANMQPAYETEFLPKTFASGVVVTKEALDDRDFDSALNEFTKLSRSYNVSIDAAMAAVLNGGFVTTASITTGGGSWAISRMEDAKPLFSTAHPRYDGGTAQSNASSTSAPLDSTSLEDAIQAIMEQVTDDGVPVSLMGRPVLVVPPALAKTATELTKSEFSPEDSNGNINFFKGLEFDVMVCTWLGAKFGGLDTQWIVVYPDAARLLFVDRQGPMLEHSLNDDTKDHQFDITSRWAVGHADWRGSYGSKGNNAAYSS